jgi:hypothetical protein
MKKNWRLLRGGYSIMNNCKEVYASELFRESDKWNWKVVYEMKGMLH